MIRPNPDWYIAYLAEIRREAVRRLEAVALIIIIAGAASILAYSIWLGFNQPPAHPDTEQPYQSERGLP